MPVGTAENLGTQLWAINADGGGLLARFDHRQFPLVRDGARVTFIDADGDGLAENVQPVHAIARYMARVAAADTLDEPTRTQLSATIMDTLLAAATEIGKDRRIRLRRLRTNLDRFRPPGLA